jgi:hypothetical protein
MSPLRWALGFEPPDEDVFALGGFCVLFLWALVLVLFLFLRQLSGLIPCRGHGPTENCDCFLFFLKTRAFDCDRDGSLP